jgi:hypothetical protein
MRSPRQQRRNQMQLRSPTRTRPAEVSETHPAPVELQHNALTGPRLAELVLHERPVELFSNRERPSDEFRERDRASQQPRATEHSNQKNA